MSLLPPLAAFFESGIFEEDEAATITVPGGAPVTATVIWLPDEAATASVGGGAAVFDNLPRLACRVSDVPALPVLTRIVASPLGGGTPVTWIVRRLIAVDGEVHTVAVQRSA